MISPRLEAGVKILMERGILEDDGVGGFRITVVGMLALAEKAPVATSMYDAGNLANDEKYVEAAFTEMTKFGGLA